MRIAKILGLTAVIIAFSTVLTGGTASAAKQYLHSRKPKLDRFQGVNLFRNRHPGDQPAVSGIPRAKW